MYKIMFFMEDAEAVQNLTSMLPEEFKDDFKEPCLGVAPSG